MLLGVQDLLPLLPHSLLRVSTRLRALMIKESPPQPTLLVEVLVEGISGSHKPSQLLLSFWGREKRP